VIWAAIANGGGNPTVSSDGTTTMERVWVKATINGSDYLFDPAFKSYSTGNKINIGQVLGYSQSDFLTGAGGTLGDYDSYNIARSIQNMREDNIRTMLGGYATSLINNLRNNYPNSTIDQIIGNRSIIQTTMTSYQTSLPFSTTIISQWDDFPADKSSTITIQHVGINYTCNTSDLSGKRLTLNLCCNR
jgi:hypothetical protein